MTDLRMAVCAVHFRKQYTTKRPNTFSSVWLTKFSSLCWKTLQLEEPLEETRLLLYSNAGAKFRARTQRGLYAGFVRGLILSRDPFPIPVTECIRESVDSLCRDGADTPMPPYIGKAFTRTNFEDLSLFRYMIMVCEWFSTQWHSQSS